MTGLDVDQPVMFQADHQFQVTYAGTAGVVSDTWFEVGGPPCDSEMVFSGMLRRVAIVAVVQRGC